MKNKFCQKISFFLKKFYKHLILMFLVLFSGFMIYQYKDSFLEMNQKNIESFKKILNVIIFSEKSPKIKEKKYFFKKNHIILFSKSKKIPF